MLPELSMASITVSMRLGKSKMAWPNRFGLCGVEWVVLLMPTRLSPFQSPTRFANRVTRKRIAVDSGGRSCS